MPATRSSMAIPPTPSSRRSLRPSQDTPRRSTRTRGGPSTQYQSGPSSDTNEEDEEEPFVPPTPGSIRIPVRDFASPSHRRGGSGSFSRTINLDVQVTATPGRDTEEQWPDSERRRSKARRLSRAGSVHSHYTDRSDRTFKSSRSDATARPTSGKRRRRAHVRESLAAQQFVGEMSIEKRAEVVADVAGDCLVKLLRWDEGADELDVAKRAWNSLQAMRQTYIFSPHAPPFPTFPSLVDALNPSNRTPTNLARLGFALQMSNLTTWVYAILQPDEAGELLTGLEVDTNDLFNTAAVTPSRKGKGRAVASDGPTNSTDAARRVGRRNELFLLAWKRFWFVVVPQEKRESESALAIWLDFATFIIRNWRRPTLSPLAAIDTALPAIPEATVNTLFSGSAVSKHGQWSQIDDEEDDDSQTGKEAINHRWRSLVKRRRTELAEKRPRVLDRQFKWSRWQQEALSFIGSEVISALGLDEDGRDPERQREVSPIQIKRRLSETDPEGMALAAAAQLDGGLRDGSVDGAEADDEGGNEQVIEDDTSVDDAADLHNYRAHAIDEQGTVTDSDEEEEMPDLTEIYGMDGVGDAIDMDIFAEVARELEGVTGDVYDADRIDDAAGDYATPRQNRQLPSITIRNLPPVEKMVLDEIREDGFSGGIDPSPADEYDFIPDESIFMEMAEEVEREAAAEIKMGSTNTKSGSLISLGSSAEKVGEGTKRFHFAVRQSGAEQIQWDEPEAGPSRHTADTTRPRRGASLESARVPEPRSSRDMQHRQSAPLFAPATESDEEAVEGIEQTRPAESTSRASKQPSHRPQLIPAHQPSTDAPSSTPGPRTPIEQAETAGLGLDIIIPEPVIATVEEEVDQLDSDVEAVLNIPVKPKLPTAQTAYISARRISAGMEGFASPSADEDEQDRDLLTRQRQSTAPAAKAELEVDNLRAVPGFIPAPGRTTPRPGHRAQSRRPENRGRPTVDPRDDPYLVDADGSPLEPDEDFKVPQGHKNPPSEIHGRIGDQSSSYSRMCGTMRMTEEQSLLLYRSIQKVPMSQAVPVAVVWHLYGEFGTRGNQLMMFNPQHMKDRMRTIVKTRLNNSMKVEGRARFHAPKDRVEKIEYDREAKEYSERMNAGLRRGVLEKRANDERIAAEAAERKEREKRERKEAKRRRLEEAAEEAGEEVDELDTTGDESEYEGSGAGTSARGAKTWKQPARRASMAAAKTNKGKRKGNAAGGRQVKGRGKGRGRGQGKGKGNEKAVDQATASATDEASTSAKRPRGRSSKSKTARKGSEEDDSDGDGVATEPESEEGQGAAEQAEARVDARATPDRRHLRSDDAVPIDASPRAIRAARRESHPADIRVSAAPEADIKQRRNTRVSRKARDVDESGSDVVIEGSDSDRPKRPTRKAREKAVKCNAPRQARRASRPAVDNDEEEDDPDYVDERNGDNDESTSTSAASAPPLDTDAPPPSTPKRNLRSSASAAVETPRAGPITRGRGSVAPPTPEVRITRSNRRSSRSASAAEHSDSAARVTRQQQAPPRRGGVARRSRPYRHYTRGGRFVSADVSPVAEAPSDDTSAASREDDEVSNVADEGKGRGRKSKGREVVVEIGVKRKSAPPNNDDHDEDDDGIGQGRKRGKNNSELVPPSSQNESTNSSQDIMKVEEEFFEGDADLDYLEREEDDDDDGEGGDGGEGGEEDGETLANAKAVRRALIEQQVRGEQ